MRLLRTEGNRAFSLYSHPRGSPEVTAGFPQSEVFPWGRRCEASVLFSAGGSGRRVPAWAAHGDICAPRHPAQSQGSPRLPWETMPALLSSAAPSRLPGLSGRGFHSVGKTPSLAAAESGSEGVPRVTPSGFQKPGLCVHRADGAGHGACLCPCDHWVVIWCVLVSCPWVGAGGAEGKGRQSQQTWGQGSGPVLRMSCVEWPRSPTPLHTFRVLWVADGWLPATHVPRSPIRPPHLVPPKMIKLFLTILLTREHISR